MTGANSQGSTGASREDWWERPARLLRFPNDRSVGKLVIRRSERPPVEAQGDIVVPRNVRVTLTVHVEDGRADLSPLADLGPGDLDEIIIGHREKIRHIDLAPLGRLTGLTTLSLRGPGITNGAVVHLSALTRLLHLTLRETSVDDAALETTRWFTRLERLIVPGRPFSDAGIARLQNLAQLKWLDVSRPSERGERWTMREPRSGPAITGTGLAGLKSAHKLWMLDLEGTDLDDDGMESLAPCTHVDYLHLSQTMVGDRGLRHLEGMGNLMELYLSGTRVTDSGLVHMPALPRLLELHLSGTAVTDDGLVHLVKHPSLRGTFVWRTAVTPAVVAFLAQDPWSVDVTGVLRYRCPCCGHATLWSDGDRSSGDSCPVCGWWTDPQALAMPNVPLGWLGVSLNQARANYQAYGAVTHGRLPLVRPPRDDEA